MQDCDFPARAEIPPAWPVPGWLPSASGFACRGWPVPYGAIPRGDLAAASARVRLPWPACTLRRNPLGGLSAPSAQSTAAQHSSDTLAPPPAHSPISRRKLCSRTMAATMARPRPWPASAGAAAPR